MKLQIDNQHKFIISNNKRYATQKFGYVDFMSIVFSAKYSGLDTFRFNNLIITTREYET